MTRDPSMTVRPPSLKTDTVSIKTGCGLLYVTLSQDPTCFEIDLHLGKAGCCNQAFLEALRGMITIARRQLHPIPRKLILKQLQGIRCPQDSGFIPSCPEAIARVLAAEWKETLEGQEPTEAVKDHEQCSHDPGTEQPH